jgi:serine/threonine protein kinase
MSLCHSRNIAHRNLHPTNIFLDSNFEIKIGDFGVARFMEQGIYITQGVGALLFQAPEMVVEEQYDETVDVYSFGVILYRCFSDGLDFSDRKKAKLKRITKPQQILNAVGEKWRLAFDTRIPDIFWRLITRCWSHNPTKRPGFADIVREFTNSDQFVVEGTNLDQYREYRQRVLASVPQPTNLGVQGEAEKPRIRLLAENGVRWAVILRERSRKRAEESGGQGYKRYNFL